MPKDMVVFDLGYSLSLFHSVFVCFVLGRILIKH